MSEVLKQAVAPHVYNHSTEENNPKQTKTPNPTTSELATTYLLTWLNPKHWPHQMRHKCGPTATFQSLLLGMQNTQDHSLTKWIQHLCVLQNNLHPSVWVIIAQIWGILRCSLTSKWMVHPHKGLWFCMKRNNLCDHRENPQRTSVLPSATS